MIPFKKHVLKNGLTLIVHEDRSTPIIAVNITYKTGSRNEKPDQTGLAHLFEHLMFGGSRHVKDFDTPIQNAGGENNAFTNNDITSFHCMMPAENIDTALWLESDRMADLHLTQKKLDNQKSVVIEEFKETCLNEPYGDVWHLLSALVYKKHPYRWPVIGLIPEHISSVTLEDAQAFYQTFYQPANAVMTIAGPIGFQEALEKCQYWFEDIPSMNVPDLKLPQEDIQTEKRHLEVVADVPSDAIYMAFPMSDRLSPEYYTTDLLSDVLSNGRSSRLYQRLQKEKELFNSIDAYITGYADPGMFLIEGKLNPGVTLEQAEAAIWEELQELHHTLISDEELQKLKNKTESTITFQECNVMTKAINLSFFESLGDADLINREVAMYQSIKSEDLQAYAREIFVPEKASVLYYRRSPDADAEEE